MNAEQLLTAINDLDDDLILDAANESVRPKSIKRRFSTILIAAAIASTLAITAFASKDGSFWFRSFFAQNTSQELSSSQQAYISENTAELNQTQTVNGYTITLESAFSDGNRTFIQCKLTAPEGIILDAYKYQAIHNTVFIPKDPVQEQSDSVRISSYGWEKEDDDPTDNEVTMIFTYSTTVGESEASTFTSHPWQLFIYGLQGIYREGEGMDMYNRKENLTEGAWVFEIQFPEDSDRTIELITEPVDCPCLVQMGIEWEGNQGMPILEEATVSVTSFQLRALSADFYYRYAEKEQINADFGDFYVVMKDGQQILMQPSSGGPNFNGFKFETPIILDEVSHVLLPDETKLYLPTE